MKAFQLFATCDNLYKASVTVLLTCILIVLIMVYLRMPPTIGDYRAVLNQEKRLTLSNKIPVISGNVTCDVTSD